MLVPASAASATDRNGTFVSATQLTCTTSAHTAGAADVVVTNPDTQAATSAIAFTYTTVCPLTVTQARPADRALPVGRTVTLVKSFSTVPQCRLDVAKSANYRAQSARGDIATPVKIWLSKSGSLKARAHTQGAKAKVRATAIAVDLPYTVDSRTWKRTWKS